MLFIKIAITRNGHIQNLSVLVVSAASTAPLFPGPLQIKFRYCLTAQGSNWCHTGMHQSKSVLVMPIVHVWFFWLLWFYFTFQIGHWEYAVDAKHENYQKWCCVTLEHKIWWAILLYCCWNCYGSIFRQSLFFELWYTESFSFGNETLMRHALMSFHILSWSFMLICFTGRILGFFSVLQEVSEELAILCCNKM